MKAVLKNSGLATRRERRKVRGHAALYHEWWLALASQYLDAYRKLPVPSRPVPPYWPRYFLLGHSVELVFKGFLGRKGLAEAQLEEFGHNIRPLLKKACQQGLTLPRRVRATIARLDDIHAEHWARYPKNHSAPTIIVEEFEPAVDKLFSAVADQTGGLWSTMVKF